MIQRPERPPLTSLQQKLREKALADIEARRELAIAPLRARFDTGGGSFTHVLDADREDALRLAIEAMIPRGSRLSVADEWFNPEVKPINLALGALGKAHGMGATATFWFEEHLESTSVHVDFRERSYGMVRAGFHAACAMAGYLIQSGSVLARSGIAIVSDPPSAMLWIERGKASACRRN